MAEHLLDGRPIFLILVNSFANSHHDSWPVPGVPARIRLHPILALVALLMTPFSWFLSWWEAGLGLHVLPLFIIAFGQLVALRKLDVRRAWFAVMFASWIGTLAPDLLATWTSYSAHVYVVDHWYGGIGGWGLTDALFQFPFFSLLLLSGSQTAILKKVQTK